MTDVTPAPVRSEGYRLALRSCEWFEVCRDYTRSKGWRGFSCTLCPCNRAQATDAPIEMTLRRAGAVPEPDIRSAEDLRAALGASAPAAYREAVERSNTFGLHARPSLARRRWFERRRRRRRRRG